MKKLLFGITAIATLSMLASSTGFSQGYGYSNQVGLYEFSDGTGRTYICSGGTPITVYLVLTKPTDVQNEDSPYSTINAFECMLNFNPVGNLFLLGETLPPYALNVGDNTDISAGFLEYIVGIGNDWPVTNESVMLIAFTFMHTAPGWLEVTLGPTFSPSIPGEMAFQSVSGELRVMYPISGSHDDPVFIFECEVAVDIDSFGSVKALYR